MNEICERFREVSFRKPVNKSFESVYEVILFGGLSTVRWSQPVCRCLLNLFETSAYRDFIRRVIPSYFKLIPHGSYIYSLHKFWRKYVRSNFYPFYLSRTIWVLCFNWFFLWLISFILIKRKPKRINKGSWNEQHTKIISQLSLPM